VQILLSRTLPGWFAASHVNLAALMSDHLHCERKAAENALGLIRRYPGRSLVERLTRLAHEETSHLVQVGALMRELGLPLRADAPNLYARALLAKVSGREPERLVDALLCAALIEARSHERLSLLEAGFAGRGETRLADFYGALGAAEERHATSYVDLAEEAAPAAMVRARLAELAAYEAEIVGGLPHGPRIH
jgi:tRNA-(ms[2]io[6]A)-hydroxylase